MEVRIVYFFIGIFLTDESVFFVSLV